MAANVLNAQDILQAVRDLCMMFVCGAMTG